MNYLHLLQQLYNVVFLSPFYILKSWGWEKNKQLAQGNITSQELDPDLSYAKVS